ncbi:MAG: NADP oxidoreductase [Blastocatellia bacterium]|nr:NADP oxidoreductase [Blastocatellia bacterium]
MTRPRLLTAWLDGCSGCHMSLLDIDERLIDLAARAEVVMSPLIDVKEIPEGIDVAIVEGAVGNVADLEKIRAIRQRTKILVSLGDCAVTANVPAMRNPIGVAPVMRRVYLESGDLNPQQPTGAPALLPQARPIHEYVPVDLFVPGCPPSADTIWHVLSELLAGRMPDLSEMTRFGA